MKHDSNNNRNKTNVCRSFLLHTTYQRNRQLAHNHFGMDWKSFMKFYAIQMNMRAKIILVRFAKMNAQFVHWLLSVCKRFNDIECNAQINTLRFEWEQKNKSSTRLCHVIISISNASQCSKLAELPGGLYHDDTMKMWKKRRATAQSNSSSNASSLIWDLFS